MSEMMGRYRTPALASLCAFCAAWMVMMANRYFTQSAADLEGGLGIGADDGSWLTTAYSAAEPIGVAIGCWLAMGLSIRRVLLPAVFLFLAASTALGFSPGPGGAIVARSAMGFAAGVIMPLSILTQLRAFDLTWRPVGIALYATATTLASQIAAPVGSFAVLHFGWQAMLWLSFPPGLAALIAGFAGLWREPVRWRPIIHADLAGVASLSSGLWLLACGLSQGNRLRWFNSPTVLALLAGGAACMLIFVCHEWRHVRHPIVAIRLTRRWNLTLGALATLPFQFATMLSGAFIPNFLVSVQGFRAEQIAPVLLGTAWTQFISYPVVALALRFHWVDARALMVVGLSSVGLAALLNVAATSDWMAIELMLGQLLQGLGLPLIIVPLLVLFVGEVKPAEGAYAASIFNIARSLAATASSAWVATTMRLDGQASYAELLANTGFYPDGRRGVLSSLSSTIGYAASDTGRNHLRAVQHVAAEARRQAAVLGSSEAFVLLGALLFCSCGLALMMAEFGSGHPDRQSGARAS
ncbi:MFS transporter [Methylorubrum rhodesianum]|uniref:MFS transporter n=1 Tax=Methylorubrum rhodesianum TaxID=29427 RepID=A0ABU9Z8P7_9HYPH